MSTKLNPALPRLKVLSVNYAQLSFSDLLALNNEELGELDIAYVNLVCASGLPGTQNLNIKAHLDILDRAAEQVEYNTQRCRWFKDHPQKYNHSFNLFRIHVMVSVLQRDFGVYYNPRCIPEDSTLYPEDVFLHGILGGTGGTCASLPVIYTAVGRRLNYPLKLVTAACHLFFRWDDPNGEKFNICASNNSGFDNPDDNHFRTGRYPITPKQEQEGRFLISLSPRQELAQFLAQRGYCWLDLGNYKEAALSFVQASALDLENKLAAAVAANILNKWHQSLKSQLPPYFPLLDIKLPPRRFPSIPQWVESQFISLETLQKVLTEPQYQGWWELLRQFPDARASSVPRQIRIELAQ